MFRGREIAAGGRVARAFRAEDRALGAVRIRGSTTLVPQGHHVGQGLSFSDN